MTLEIIQSTKNEKIKEIRSLCNKKDRYESQSFIVEGYNIIKDMPLHARAKKFLIKKSSLEKCLPLTSKFNAEVLVSEDFVFDSVSDTVSGSGIIAVVEMPDAKPLSSNIALVCDGISDAGNMGTIIRTAAAMGITDIVGVGGVDFYNPKTVRSTMGGIFHVNLVNTSEEELSSVLGGYTLVALDMNGEDVFDFVPSEKLALAVGSEAHGVSEAVRKSASRILSIPMPSGNVESLNAAVSVSIALAVVAHSVRKI